MELLRPTTNAVGNADPENADGGVAVVEHGRVSDTVISTKTSLLLVVFYQGLLRSFGHFNHDEMIAVYFLVVLAFTPCGDEFSIDSWLEERQNSNGPRLRMRIRSC